VRLGIRLFRLGMGSAGIEPGISGLRLGPDGWIGENCGWSAERLSRGLWTTA